MVVGLEHIYKTVLQTWILAEVKLLCNDHATTGKCIYMYHFLPLPVVDHFMFPVTPLHLLQAPL